MKSFKDYANQSSNTNNTQKTVSMAEDYTQDKQTAEELTKQIASAYNGMNQMDLLKNILIEAEKSKRAGTLSNQEIETFYQNFSPMLSGFQRKKLREIVDKLKIDYDIWVNPNGGELADKMFRVGHIGDLTIEDNDKLIEAFNDLKDRGIIY